MPVSLNQGKDLIEAWLRAHVEQYFSVLDIGAGAGWYGKKIKEIAPSKHCIAVEAWQPYIEKYGLKKIYDDVFVHDVRRMISFPYDLTIFGDVLEHLPKKYVRPILENTLLTSKFVIVSIPVGPMPQGPVYGNPFEEHLGTWSWAELCDIFKNFEIIERYKDIAVFINKI
jgi:hypothetical protein